MRCPELNILLQIWFDQGLVQCNSHLSQSETNINASQDWIHFELALFFFNHTSDSFNVQANNTPKWFLSYALFSRHRFLDPVPIQLIF